MVKAAKSKQVKKARETKPRAKSSSAGRSGKIPQIPCPKCDATFKTKGGLNSHRKRKHPEIIRPSPGHPLKFESVEELEAAISKYFTSCEPAWIEQEDLIEDYEMVDANEGLDANKPRMENRLKVVDGKVQYTKQIRMVKKEAVVPTVSGLAYALDTTRRTLLDYEDRDEYAHTIKRAKGFIEAANEALLVNGGAVPAGVIFNLKNNWGWVDKSELSVTDKAAAAKKALDRLEDSAAPGGNDFATYAEQELNGQQTAH